MKETLFNRIKEGLKDMCYIWAKEMRQTVTDEGTKTQTNNGAHHPSVVELVTHVGVERHQGAVVVEIDTQADTGEDVTIEIEAVSS